MKVAATITLTDLVFAGWLISILSLFAALVFFHKLIKEFHPTVDPLRHVQK